ncbi:MAG TPA: DoxX family protein [Ktedonobacteraceae bacterium]|nr:DoxX family protein [Ktedonobacteraceae bacterium]
MLHFKSIEPRTVSHLPQPALARFLFSDVRMAWLWLIVRLFVGYQWLTAGWGKLTGYSLAFDSFGKTLTTRPWIMSGHDGTALQSFIKGAITLAGGTHPNVQSWYALFLQNAVLPHTAAFSYVITFGEVLVGLGLIVGAFTGVAAFFGVFMNINYLFAGSLSINPLLTLLGILLVLSWRIAGYYGLDRWSLPLLLALRMSSLRPKYERPSSQPEDRPSPTSRHTQDKQETIRAKTKTV